VRTGQLLRSDIAPLGKQSLIWFDPALMEIVVRDREELKLLQSNITGYMLDEVIWRIRNEARRAWKYFGAVVLKY
jgi:hypothetical protein